MTQRACFNIGLIETIYRPFCIPPPRYLTGPQMPSDSLLRVPPRVPRFEALTFGAKLRADRLFEALVVSSGFHKFGGLFLVGSL